MAEAVLDRSLDFGVITFQPAARGVQTIPLGTDDIVLLTAPGHPLATKRRVTIEEVGRQVVIAHNDPSPTRDRVLRAYERRHTAINIQLSLPSLDGIKRAVEMGIGVALLPRRCALTEIARGHLVAIKVPELGAPRQVRLVFRRTGERSRASEAFLALLKA
jgi:DNA-binding transcriptional LysR family regulator